MKFKEYYEFQRADLLAKVNALGFWKIAVFATLCCERLLPNYQYFSRIFEFGDPALLSEVIHNSWTNINIKEANVENFKVQKSKLEAPEVIPDTMESGMFASWALDAHCAIYDLARYFISEDSKYAVDIAMASFETIQKFVFENYGYLDDSVPNYEDKLMTYAVYKKEKATQKAHLDFLDKEILITPDLIKKMQELQDKDRSNIGLS